MARSFQYFLTKVRGKSRFLLKRTLEKVFWQWKVGKHVAKKVENYEFGALESSDISDHLNLLSLVLHLQKPKYILELGTRGGESTKVFERYCADSSCTGRSIDLEPAPIWLQNISHWKHFTGDDCLLGEYISRTNTWPDGEPFQPIDVLFVDTSHEYQHTKRELQTYFPLLAQNAIMIFHDTNLVKNPTRRLDGNLGYGWDNKRGVIRAIEEFFSIQVFEENYFLKTFSNSQVRIYHRPWNNGLTIVQRV